MRTRQPTQRPHDLSIALTLLILIGTSTPARCADDGRAPATGQTEQDAAAPRGRISFNFHHAPWIDVLKLFASASGLALDVADTPTGTLTYFDTAEYTPEQAIDLLNGFLLPKGYVLVRRENVLMVTSIRDGVPPNLVPSIPLEELPRRGRNELLNVVIPLQHGDPAVIAKEVEQLLGPQGQVVPLHSSNSLVVTDTGGNLQRIHALVGGQQADGGRTAFRVFRLQHIPASLAQQMIRDLFGLDQHLAAPLQPSLPQQPGRPLPLPVQPPARTSVKLTVDPRTNKLLVAASAAELALIEEIVQAIDVDDGSSAAAPDASAYSPVVRVLPLGSAQSAALAQALGSLSPQIRVSTSRSGAPAQQPRLTAGPQAGDDAWRAIEPGTMSARRVRQLPPGEPATAEDGLIRLQIGAAQRPN